MVKISSPSPTPLAGLLDAIRALYGATDRFDSAVAETLAVDRTAVRTLNLLEHGAVSPGRIGAALTLTSGAVTAVLHRLEDAGYVRRVTAADDARRRDATLTNAGRHAVHREFERLGTTIARTFADRPPEELERLADGLRTLAHAFDAAAARPT